jgi:hypothetical protein
MIEVQKVKKGSLIVLRTRQILPDKLVEEITEKLKQVFPECEVLLPNGAELTILEAE